MSQIMMIGGLFEGSLLAWWWIGRTRANRKHQRHSSAMQREITALRHALSEMAMDKHHSHDNPRRRQG